MFRKKKKTDGAEGVEGEAAEEAKEEAKEAKQEAKEAGEAAEGAESVEGEGGEGGHKKGKRKLIFIAGGAVALILIVVGLLLSGVLGGGEEEAAGEHGETVAGIAHPVYYELPQFLVNLSAPGNRVSFLKMSVTLELRDEAAVAVLEANKPRVLDSFNTYLRELRPADVQGSAGIYRLREELMARINGTIEEGLVKDILFSEIIVQ